MLTLNIYVTVNEPKKNFLTLVLRLQAIPQIYTESLSPEQAGQDTNLYTIINKNQSLS